MPSKLVPGLLTFAAVLAGRLSAQERPLDAAARLDGEHKCVEAEQIYQDALAGGAPSPALLNNLGNHYLNCGEPDKARAYFERLLVKNFAHVNANLQLAHLAIQRKDGAAALGYLSRIPGSDPEALLARAEALQQTGRGDAAAAAIDSLARTAASDPRLLFALGITCGRMGLYDRAEAAFTALLAQVPDDYDVLYNLGLAAARAGHAERARRAFEVALKERPDDVDSLYQLGRVHSDLHDYPRAVFLLAQARKLAPQRPDVALALARAAQMAAFYGDCLLAYDAYLKLRPDDDAVRRDRALVAGYTRNGLDESLAELTRYVAKYPKDALGFHDLAQLTERVDRDRALGFASTAVRLDPKFEAARYYRAWLLQKLGRNQESVAEVQVAIRLNPADARALDLLGLDYLTLEKPADAERPLRQALALAPDDPDVLFHLGRALMELGRAAEARPFLDRFQKVRQEPSRVPREEAGVIESAGLTDAERARQVTEQLRQFAAASPREPALKMNLAAALLADGNVEEAEAAYRELLAMNPTSALSQQAGANLLRYERYDLARTFLELAAADRPAALLDLAIALYHTEGSQAALQTLEQVQGGDEGGDSLLLKAKILDAEGQTTAAEGAIEESVRYSISRPRLAQEAALLLVRHNQGGKALALVDRAARNASSDADLLLTRAVVLAALHRDGDAENGLKQIESRWPEWDRPYLIEGLLLERSSKLPEARRKIQIATALGTREVAAQCALDRMAGSKATDSKCACQRGIYEPFFPGCPAK